MCLEFFILKFTKPLQSYCCPVQKNPPRKAELARQVSRYFWRGSVDCKKKSRPFFIIIFKLKNSNFKTRDFSPLIERVLAGVSEEILSLFPYFMQWEKPFFDYTIIHRQKTTINWVFWLSLGIYRDRGSFGNMWGEVVGQSVKEVFCWNKFSFCQNERYNCPPAPKFYQSLEMIHRLSFFLFSLSVFSSNYSVLAKDFWRWLFWLFQCSQCNLRTSSVHWFLSLSLLGVGGGTLNACYCKQG